MAVRVTGAYRGFIPYPDFSFARMALNTILDGKFCGHLDGSWVCTRRADHSGRHASLCENGWKRVWAVGYPEDRPPLEFPYVVSKLAKEELAIMRFYNHGGMK